MTEVRCGHYYFYQSEGFQASSASFTAYWAYPSYSPHQYRPQALSQSYDQTYPFPTLLQPRFAVPSIERPPVSYPTLVQPCYAAQIIERPPALYLRPRAPQMFVPLALRTPKQFSQLGMSLSQIRVETSTFHEGLIHMLTDDKATCIVFSTDDLPFKGSNHTLHLYIFVGCFGH